MRGECKSLLARAGFKPCRVSALAGMGQGGGPVGADGAAGDSERSEQPGRVSASTKPPSGGLQVCVFSIQEKQWQRRG